MQQVDETDKNDAVDAIRRREHATKIAKATVSKAINEAVAWLESDPEEFFLYRYPRECVERTQNRLQLNRISALDAAGSFSSAKGRRNSVRAVTETNAKFIDWLRIEEFSLHRLVQLVYDYLSLWRLTPNTQYIVRLENDVLYEEPQGSTYSLNALFTRQPQRELVRCNPLTMAHVNFKVRVSHLLPKFYPVMMTYRFENCSRDYYAIGNRRMCRLDFQRFFIDMALETKLGFYAQLLKTLAFATEQKFADNQKDIRRGDKTRERDARAKRLKSTATLCICGAEESERKMKERSNENEALVKARENESKLIINDEDSAIVVSCEYGQAENTEVNEDGASTNEYSDEHESVAAGCESENVATNGECDLNNYYNEDWFE